MQAQNGLTEVRDFGPDPGNLRMFYFAPDSAAPGPAPLLVALHGCMQSPAEMARQSGWLDLARERGFYLLLPDQKGINNPSSCFNWFRAGDHDKDRGEAASIRQMVRYMRSRFDIDSTRIFCYGLSAGGAMCAELMADYPGLFAGGAVLGGGPAGAADNLAQAGKTMAGNLQLSRDTWAARVTARNPDYRGPWPRLVVLHCSADPTVDPRSADALVQQWTALHGLPAEADSTDRQWLGHPQVERRSWGDTEAPPVIYYMVRGLGHALPVHPGEGPARGGATGLFATDIGFHSTWYIARDFGL